MFLSIYKTGNFLKSQNLDQAFSHHGEYWVVNIEDINNLHLYSISRISQKLKIKNFLLEGCERVNNGYRFKFCDLRDNKLYEKYILLWYIENSLSFLIKCLHEASEFPNWETYNDFLQIEEYKKKITILEERISKINIDTQKKTPMITNILHERPEFIGINIEKDKECFNVCVAFKSGKKWMAKTLAGISGDLNDLLLFDKAISIGQNLDKKTASEIFTTATGLGLEFSDK
jgi:hypothetical protein